jgi:hypothetical protein
MQRLLLALTASLCVLTACGPEEGTPKPASQRAAVASAPAEPDAHTSATAPAPGEANASPTDAPASLKLSKVNINFGQAQTCATTPPDEFKIFNLSTTTTFNILSASVNSGNFDIVEIRNKAGLVCSYPCPVPPTSESSSFAVSVKVAFSPKMPGDLRGILTLQTDDPDAPTLTLPLYGEAEGPLVVVSQTSVAFSPQKLNTASTPYTLTLTNLGNLPFAATPVTAAPFTVSAGSLNIPESSTRTLTVTFTPTQKGQVFGALNLGGGTQCPAPSPVWLSGEGLSPAKLTLSSSTLAFPMTTVGAVSEAQEVIVTNSGDYSMNVTQQALTSGAFQVTPTGSYSLAPGATRRLLVTFRPNVAGAPSEDLQFTVAGDGSTQPKVALSGTATAATVGKLVLSHTVMSFPQTPAGSVSPSQEITLRNDGGSRLSVSALSLSPASSPFVADTAPPIELTPGETRTVKLTFKPGPTWTTGSATMTFTNTGSTTPTLTLSGATPPVVATKLVLDRTVVDFGTRDACTSKEETVVLRNQSGSNRKILSASITGGFSLVGLYTSPTTLCALPCTVLPSTQANPNEVSVKVAFGQKQPGDFQGTLTLYTDDPDMPSLTAALNGTAEGPLLVFEQPTVNFGRQERSTLSQPRQLTVINLGNKPFSDTPSTNSPFTVTSGNLTIPAGQSRQVAVTFQPTLRTQYTGSLKLTNGSTFCPTPPTATLKGEGFLPAKLVLSRPSLAFQQTQVGATSVAQEVTVRNDGDELLSVTQLKLDQDLHFLLDPSGTFHLAPGDSQLLKVSFKPAVGATGTVSDTLTFVGAGAGAPTLSLTGTAAAVTPGKLVLSRALVAFPQTPVGSTSAAQEFTLTNTGGKPVTVSKLKFTQALHFTVDTASEFTLTPGQTQPLKVSFEPTASGNVSDELTFETTDDPSAPKLQVSGTATPVLPGKLVLTRASLAFPQTATGNASATQAVTVQNDGGKPVTVNRLTFAQNLHFKVDTAGPFTLAPGGVQPLKVTFKPAAIGDAQDDLTFETTDDPTAPKLHVSGAAVAGTACIGLAPLSFSFSDQEAGDPVGEQKLVTVTNTGTVAVTVTPEVTQGAPHYTVSSTAPFTLDPNTTGVDLFIKFKPLSNASGDVDGTLTFNTSPSTLPSCKTSVPLRGNARKTYLIVNPTSLAFGDWTVSDTPPIRQVTLRNPTKWPVKVNSVSPETLAPYTLMGIPSEGLTIAANSTVSLTVAFATTTWGEAFPRTINFETDASEEVAPVSITGRALAPELSFKDNPDGTLVFPNAAPGGERLATATLYNTGNHPLFLSKIAAERPTPDSEVFFQAVDFLAQTIPAGGKTTVKLRFSPLTSVGDLQARLRFYTTSDRLLPQVLILKGNSNGPNAVFGVTEIDFGPSQVNVTQSDEKKLTLRNAPGASEALRVTAIRVVQSGSPFSVEPLPSNEPVLTPGSTRTPPFKVSFRPTEVGTQYRDNLEIEYRGVNSGLLTTRSFVLKGLGADAELSSDESLIEFPATLKDATSEEDLIVKNPGLIDAFIESVTLYPSNGFIADVEGWPERRIKAGQTRKIKLKFNPTVTTGSYSSKLSIRLTTTAPTLTALEVDLTGVASIAKLELNPSQIVFGEVPRRTTKSQLVTLKNLGSARLTVSNVQASDIFTVQPADGRNFPIFLEKDQTADIQVSFRPDTTTPVSTTLKVISDSDQTPEMPITVSGVGTVPMIVMPGGIPQFAPQAIDIEGPAQRVPVRNDGKANLVVEAISVTGEFCLRPDPLPSPLPATCPTSLGGFTVRPSETYSFFISAKPSARDERRSKLIIASNNEQSPLSMDIKVNGVGSVTLPSGVVFGPVNFGTSLDKEVTVQNSGITPASVSVSFDTGVSEFTAVDQTLEVPPGSSAQLKLRFRPLGSTAGPRSASAKLVVQGGAQVPFTLEAIATTVRMAVTRKDGKTFGGALDFGGTRVNANSDFISLTLTHVAPGGVADAGTDGGVDSDKGQLTIQDIAVEGVDSKAFVIEKPSRMPVSLGRGGSMDLPIQFRPDAQRNFNAVLRITSDDSQAKILAVTLSGRGRTNQLSLSTPTLEFGARVAESSTSAVRSVRITNESLQPLQVAGLEIIGAAENSEPSHFNVESGPALPFMLAAQESKEIFVKFVPRPDTTSKAALLVVTSDLESPTAQVSLSGRGLRTVFRSLNGELDFGTVRQSEPMAKTVTLTNDTTQELVLMQPKLEGPQATSFTVVSPNLGAEGHKLSQGDSLTMELRYDTTVVGSAKATLLLSTKDQERAAKVELSGITVASYLTIEPMELDLGWVDIGATSTPRTVTVTNQSASPATLSMLENTNPAFTVDTSALDAPLAPGAQATLTITFQGQVGGPTEGTVKLRMRGAATTDANLVLKGQARTLGGTGGGCACGTSGDGAAALSLLLLLGLALGRQARRTRVGS